MRMVIGCIGSMLSGNCLMTVQPAIVSCAIGQCHINMLMAAHTSL